jgi:8-oxo-dGTP diphosphatase
MIIIIDGKFMPKDRFKLISAVHLLLIRDGKVLLLHRFNTGYEDGNYSVPAGHLDGNEPVSEAMAREAKEEIGVFIDPTALRVVHVMHRQASPDGHQANERVDFFLTTSQWDDKPSIMEPDKCDELSWRPLDNLPHNTIPYIRAAIEAYRSGKYYSEFGWAPAPYGSRMELTLSRI